MRASRSVAALVGAGLIFTGAASANAMLASLDGTQPPKQPGFAGALSTARGQEAVRVAQWSMPLD
jgi:hypothetical protein